jgi:hypothetical protein
MPTDIDVGDQRAFNERIVRTLEALEIPYAIGGSVAAMLYSKAARLTNDVDFMLDADAALLTPFVATVESWHVYVDPIETIVEDLLPAGLPINILDGMLGTKADVFIVSRTGLDQSSMRRRRRQMLYVKPDVAAWLLAPEDVILYKLMYFLKSDGTSQKHPKDIHNMFRAVEAELDFEYIAKWVSALGFEQVWQTTLREYRR